MLGYDPGLDWSPREVGQERKAEMGGGRGCAAFSGILRRQWWPTKVAIRKAVPSLQSASPLLSPHLLSLGLGLSWQTAWGDRLSRSMPGLPGRHLVYQLCAPGRVTQVPFYEWERLGGICGRAVCSE